MSDDFNFFQQWYPLSPLQDLKRDRPTAVTLLGMRLVIWRARDAERFQVFVDQCPHRLAPLSEGRIDEQTGLLMCSYHGWQFDQTGKCTRIPQVDPPEQKEENSQLFCVTRFPSREEQGLLWVWADPQTPDLAERMPLPLTDQLDADQGFVWDSFVRDLACDWETLIENVADPSHVPFAHHGVQGDRRHGKPIPISIEKSTKEEIIAYLDRDIKTTITFQPPCRLEYRIQLGNGEKKLGLVTYCIPVSPGQSRIVAHFTRNFAQNIQKMTPRWWEHIRVRNAVLDGDMILLHHQEYFFHQNQKDWKKAYRLPTSADRLVIEFRRWFARYCQNRLPWEKVGLNLVSPQINSDRRVLLDRYSQHTQHCHSCRQALERVQKTEKLLLVYFSVSIAVLAALGDEPRSQFGLLIFGSALFALTIYGVLKQWLEPQFYFVDYVHAEVRDN